MSVVRSQKPTAGVVGVAVENASYKIGDRTYQASDCTIVYHKSNDQIKHSGIVNSLYKPQQPHHKEDSHRGHLLTFDHLRA